MIPHILCYQGLAVPIVGAGRLRPLMPQIRAILDFHSIKV
jgi:hypothetical protein